MVNKKILILGANGYIGSRLSNLLSIDNDITILDLDHPQNSNFHKIKSIKADISNESSIDLVTNENYDVIYKSHFADHYKSQNYKPATVNNINVLPTWNLLDSFAKKDFENVHKLFNDSCLL